MSPVTPALFLYGWILLIFFNMFYREMHLSSWDVHPFSFFLFMCTSGPELIWTISRNDSEYILTLTHCPPQVEPHFLWDQCCQFGVQRGALLLCVCWRSGWLLLPSGRPRTNISGPVSRGQCLQWCVLLHQHILGLVWQRVWVAGWFLADWFTNFRFFSVEVMRIELQYLLASNTEGVELNIYQANVFIPNNLCFFVLLSLFVCVSAVLSAARKWHCQWQRCPVWHHPERAEFPMSVFKEEA